MINKDFFKIFLLLAGIIGIFLPMVSGYGCIEDNDFTLRTDIINVCSGNCTYNDPTDLNWKYCDSSVWCKFTAFYPNNSILVSYKNMTRFDGNRFNFSFGNMSDDSMTGIYRGKIRCERNDGGVVDNEFRFSVSSELVTYSTAGSGSYINTDFERAVMYVDDTIESTKASIIKHALTYFLIGFFGIFILIFIFLDWRKHRIKKIASKVHELIRKGETKIKKEGRKFT